MVPLGTAMPSFSLPDPRGEVVSSGDLADASAVLIIFMCNHCPFVKLVKDELQRLAGDYRPRGVAIIGINPNDVDNYPDDSPEKMAEEGYEFPYLYDETQTVARAFDAACTPDFFLYDKAGKLAYRGQLDDARPKSETPVTGADLRAAIDAVLDGRPSPEPQIPSIGCNIKWKP
jgi:peroxiredoxin